LLTFFDVEAAGRTKKTFGRVFYTQASLSFLCVRLDRQRGLVNANTFQVWGQKGLRREKAGAAPEFGVLYWTMKRIADG